MGVRPAVRMWTAHLTARDMDELDAGRSVEKITTEGVIVLMMDDEGKLHLTWIAQPGLPRKT